MGKSEQEQAPPAPPTSPQEPPEGNACDGCSRCCSIRRIARPRCVATLVLGVAMLLSALFWLPPFMRRYDGTGSPDRDPHFAANVVASFKLQKPVDFLTSNIRKLQVDIFEEIGVPDSTVSVIDLEPLGGSNWTDVVFGVWPYPKNSNLSSTGLSILRASFVSLVAGQSTLQLTTSLFGNSSFFQVLKFPGGIVIIPPQIAFPLQNVQMLFNFTLNFPIYQVQDKFNELKDQMKAGLLLNSNENLYLKLINLEGTTVFPPTIVRTSILLAVGNRQPSLPRWKELAKKIRGSSAGNLGLNHTLFGRVKQIRLTSFLQNSSSSASSSISPTPAPQPKADQRVHHHVHHHHHHRTHHHPMHLAPGPAPDIAPEHSYQTPAPSGCRYGFPSKPKRKGYLATAAAPAPIDSPKLSPAPAAAEHSTNQPPSAPPSVAVHLLPPRADENIPAPAPIMIPSPKPAVSLTYIPPPSEPVKDSRPPRSMPANAPAPDSSSASNKFFYRYGACNIVVWFAVFMMKENIFFWNLTTVSARGSRAVRNMSETISW